jgi:predicted dehydrogenase
MSRFRRREFLSGLAAASGALALGAYANPAAARAARGPNEKVRLAAVGATGRAGANIKEASPFADIVAIADVDQKKLDEGAAKYPEAHKYADFRVMLEKEAGQLDGVIVGTPDHTHAPAAAMALRLGKHVYCEKPLTHTVYEARTLANLAKEKKLVTQMGSQIHAGNNYRRVVELIRAKAIGDVKEVHVWAPADYSGGQLTTGTPVPEGLNWDLWQGPVAARPYSEGVHPFNWRKFWDYGTGGLGDFGCHYMDLAHWALDLRAPATVEASGPPVNKISCSTNLIVKYDHPARGKLPPVTLTWYDGKERPPMLAKLLEGLKDASGKPVQFGGGQLFVGSDGVLLSDYGRHYLLPEAKFADYKRPAESIPNSIGHHKEWIEALKTGGPTTCNFDYSGALTEAVLLGTIAYRSGEKIQWDAANLKITNSPAAQNLVHKEYRKGWTL